MKKIEKIQTMNFDFNAMYTVEKINELIEVVNFLNSESGGDYETNHSHRHCWERENPPCGMKGSHRCCICKKPIDYTRIKIDPFTEGISEDKTNYVDSRTPAEREKDKNTTVTTTATAFSPQPKAEEDWEEKFDSQFGVVSSTSYEFEYFMGKPDVKPLKSFIKSLLQKEREKWIKKLETLNVDPMNDYERGYIFGISDSIRLIRDN